MPARFFWAACLGFAVGCSSGSDYQQSGGTPGGGATTGRTGRAGSSSGTGSTSGGTASSGSTTSSSDNGICPSGQFKALSKAIDLCAGVSTFSSQIPASGVSVDSEPSEGRPVITDPDGGFGLCVAGNQDVTLTFHLGSDYPIKLEKLNLNGNQTFFTGQGGIPMICSTLFTLLQGKLDGYDSSKGAVLVAINSLTDESVCNRAGWSVSAQSSDGGPPAAPWPAVEIEYSGAVAVGPTTASGLALIYNIDGDVPAVAVQASSDAGCAPVSVPDFTGSAEVGVGYVALFPVFVP